jgi:hypothetical protein
MTTIAFPDVSSAQMSIRLVSNTRIFKSVFTGSIQTVGVPGAYWVMTAHFPVLSESDTKTLRAFQASLAGMENRFLFRDFSYTGPADAAITGTGLQNDTALSLSASISLVPGDYIQVGDELKMIISGSATSYVIAPPFRKDMTAVTVYTNKPGGIFVSETDAVGWDISVCRHGTFSITGVEDIA